MTTFNDCAGGLDSDKPPPAEDDNRLLKIKKLKTKLINEEHRLVLMKKIRQSQTRPIAPQNTNNNHHQSNNLQSGNNLNNNSIASLHNGNQIGVGGSGGGGASSSSSTTMTPGKKLRPPQTGPLSLQRNQSGHSTNLQGSSSSTSSASSSSMNQTPAHAHQRPKVNTLWNPPQQARHPTPVGIAPPHVGNLSRPPITTPPNVVQAMMGTLTGQQSLLMNQINAATSAAASARRHQQSSHQLASFNKSQAAQMLQSQQKRPSFKPSIQKQLEQTILQQQQQTQKHGQPGGGLGFSPNLNKRAVGITVPHVGNLSRQPITTPPNVVQDMRGGLSGQQSLLMNANNLQAAARRTQQPQSQQQTTFNKSQAAQMLLQKRTAAKSAIQKQLEQTLMQLPQKHVQLGIDFVPNANNIEFVYYIGLEACVDYLTDTKNPLDTQPLEKPFECSTCGTDFTPSWSWKRSNVVCENCVGNHVKKSIKNSQASRIKSVLTKAAKQEQEMDQRIMAEAANVVSTPSPASSTSQQQHSLLQPVSHHQQQHQRSTPQQQQPLWPRMNTSPMTNIANSNRSPNVQPAVNANPLAGIQPAALASLLQMNPQLSTLASIMTANNNNNNNNNNQFAQAAALLLNQLSMNLWKR